MWVRTWVGRRVPANRRGFRPLVAEGGSATPPGGPLGVNANSTALSRPSATPAATPKVPTGHQTPDTDNDKDNGHPLIGGCPVVRVVGGRTKRHVRQCPACPTTHRSRSKRQ